MATTETELASATEAPPAAVPAVKVSTKKSDSVLDKVLRLLSSVKFGLVMLSILLSCCMLGMLVMQVNVDGFDKYFANLKPAQKTVYGALGFFDIYRSRYFTLLLALTGLNIILASIDRFPAAWQYIRKPKRTASPKFIAAQMFNAEKVVDDPPARLAESVRAIWWKQSWQRAVSIQFWILLVLALASAVEIVLRVVKLPAFMSVNYLFLAWLGYLALAVYLWLKKRKGTGWVHVTDENGRLTVFAQRNTWNRLGAYVVHVALLTIFTGGFLTSRYGVGGSMEIKPGKTSNAFGTSEISLEGARQSQAFLPFQIECTDLQQKLIRPEGSLDNSNTIDWLSYIKLIDKERNFEQDMLVHLNNVGDYRGYRFFQNSFLPVGNARQITMTFEPANGGGAAGPPVTIKRNGSAEVPGIGTVRYVNFYPDFDVDNSGPTTLSRDYNNPAAQLEITGPDGKRTMSFAFNPQLAEQYLTKANEKVGKEGGENPLLVNGNKIILRDFEKVSLTHTLTIQYDPGRTPVYIGFTLLVMALCGVFFFSHQRAWAVIEPDGGGSKIHFGGNTNRNRPAFEGRFNSLVQSVTGGSRDE
ncbi:MAG: cytochrome c biogenesis protein ResB [Acidobacteriota bacterium]